MFYIVALPAFPDSLVLCQCYSLHSIVDISCTRCNLYPTYIRIEFEVYKKTVLQWTFRIYFIWRDIIERRFRGLLPPTTTQVRDGKDHEGPAKI